MRDSDREHRRRRQRRRYLRGARRDRRLVAGALGALLLAAALVAVASWGTGHRGARTVPTEAAVQLSALEGNRQAATQQAQAQAIADVLDYTEFLRNGEARKREVALTFDDGPSIYTDDILRILRHHDAPATFFALGERVDAFPQIARRALRQGHALGMHTYDHPHMGRLTSEAQAQQLASFDDVMRAHHLPIPSLFRPPYGSFDTETLLLLLEREALMVLWSVDTGDYEGPGWDVIAERALEGAEPGAVILLHDGGGDRAQTVVALPLILKGLERRGLRPVTVPQLLVDDPPPRGQSLEQATAVVPPGEDLPSEAASSGP